MAETLKASHTTYNIRYHLVWIVKYRKDLIQGSLENRLKDIFLRIGERYWFDIDVMGTDGNHIHLFLGAAPRYSPAEVVKIIKSISARIIFQEFPDIRKELWGGEFWGDGYYVRTVGDEVTEDVIKEYIEKQGKSTHHKQFKQLRFLF